MLFILVLLIELVLKSHLSSTGKIDSTIICVFGFELFKASINFSYCSIKYAFCISATELAPNVIIIRLTLYFFIPSIIFIFSLYL